MYYMTYRLLQNPVAVAAVAVPYGQQYLVVVAAVAVPYGQQYLAVVAAVAVPYGQQYLVVVVGIPPTAALDSARDA